MIEQWWGRAKWVAWVAYDRALSWAVWGYEKGRKMLGLGYMPVLIPVVAAAIAAGWVWIEKEKQIGTVRGEERAACAVKISNIRDEINAVADLRVAAAEAAALEVMDPETDAELEAICKADRYCRDREGK